MHTPLVTCVLLSTDGMLGALHNRPTLLTPLFESFFFEKRTRLLRKSPPKEEVSTSYKPLLVSFSLKRHNTPIKLLTECAASASCCKQ